MIWATIFSVAFAVCTASDSTSPATTGKPPAGRRPRTRRFDRRVEREQVGLRGDVTGSV